MSLNNLNHINYNHNNHIIGDVHKNQSHISKNGIISVKTNDNPKLNSVTINENNKYENNEEIPYHIAVLCYLSMLILTMFGYLRDFMRKTGIESNKSAIEPNRDGYVPLYQSFESFYTRNIYRRICDAWNRPICSVPGAVIQLIDRHSDDYNWTFTYPGTVSEVINMASYNYLGFAQNTGPQVDKVEQTIGDLGIGVGTSRHEIGTMAIHNQLEYEIAKFVGVESSIVFGMGFATNSANIPTLVGKGCLIFSDELNHASLILGCRTSGASIKVFRHNDLKDLEKKVRNAIVTGQPKTHRPWRKIIIIVEGIYSMEGTIVNLPGIIRIKKKYKCYIYLDEAHSIGAIGPNGRGAVDYFGCDPNDIDLLMGTFTKSFGAAGGYIAGRKEIIDHIRIHSINTSYANSMAPVIAQQILCVLKIITGEDGTCEGKSRIERLRRNSKYFRGKLKRLGFIIYGIDDSPVVPIMFGFCSTITCCVRLGLKYGVGMVGAGFPATTLTTARVRFCVSAAHTKEMLDKAIEGINILGDTIAVKFSRRIYSNEEIIY